MSLDNSPGGRPRASRAIKLVLMGIAGAALLFKGSGFYKTDYRSEGYKKAAASDSGSKSSSEGKASKSSGKSSSE